MPAALSVRERHSRMRPPAVDEGLKTDALPGVAAVVVVARHPAHAGVVSAEFGERRRAGNGIRHVIVAAVGMRDGVPANRAGATLKPYDLALKAIIARQDDAATVQKRQQIAEQFTLGLLGQVIRDAMLAEQLTRKLAGVSVAGHTADTIRRWSCLDQKFVDLRLRSKAPVLDDAEAGCETLGSNLTAFTLPPFGFFKNSGKRGSLIARSILATDGAPSSWCGVNGARGSGFPVERLADQRAEALSADRFRIEFLSRSIDRDVGDIPLRG